jgi:sigma-B regulation protein RsbU (phosphoserine phosphatase)
VNVGRSSQSHTDRLALLYRLSQTFNSSLDLDEVLNRVMDEVVATTRAERGFVMLREADGSLDFRVARGMDRETIDDPQFQISRGVVERVAEGGQPMLTSDAQMDDRLSLRMSVLSLGLRSILCVPLKLKDQVTGVIYVDNRLQGGVFVQDDLELLTAIASSAAIALENARLYQVAVEKGRLEQELQMARTVQASLLPAQAPQFPGWEFAAQWQPAREVSGDFYDFVPTHSGQLALLIADVVGKGMPAALFMALSRTILRASVGDAPSLAEGMARANRLVCADAAEGMFVTVFCALLGPETGEVTYVNAGHNPPLLRRQGDSGEGKPLTELRPTGIALGVLEDSAFEQRSVYLEPGDCLLLYTDGVPDATGTEAQRFGMERLRHVFLKHQHEPAAGIIASLSRAIGEFTGAMPQFDDIAIMIAKRV